MFWRKKHLHGLDAIAKYFKLDVMDVWTWHRSRADPPPIWKENSVWICEVRAMKAWLKENGLLPKKASLLETIKAERNRKNERQQQRNQRNWQRTINRHHRRDWKPTGEQLKKGRMW